VTKREVKFYKRMVAVGLVKPRKTKEAETIGQHITSYFAKRTDVKPNTLTHWRHAERSLLAFFGAECPLARVTPGDARDFERWLKTGDARENQYGHKNETDGLETNTIRKRVDDSKQFFKDAVSRELIAKNPFAGLEGTVGSNRDRDCFVSPEDALKVLEACPDTGVASALCPEPLGRSTLPLRAFGADMGRY
jgi:hypothetical protein